MGYTNQTSSGGEKDSQITTTVQCMKDIQISYSWNHGLLSWIFIPQFSNVMNAFLSPCDQCVTHHQSGLSIIKSLKLYKQTTQYACRKNTKIQHPPIMPLMYANEHGPLYMHLKAGLTSKINSTKSQKLIHKAKQM